MKLFSHLFAKPPPPPPPTPAERVASLQAAPAEVIETTALGGDDVSLRVAAIRLLPGGDALRVLAGLADPPPGVAASTPSTVQRAAHERLAQLIDDGSIDFDAVCGQPEYLSESIAVAALCKDPDRLARMLARIDDQAALATLATDGPSSRVRQLAAAAIHDPAQLHDLLPRVRGKDKSVYKLIKQKCDALAAAKREAEEYAREVTELCASLERHSTRAHDAAYATTLEALTVRWRALPARPDPQVEQRGEQALERCREFIAAHELHVAEQAAARAAQREAEERAREARERELEVERQATAERAEAQSHALAEVAAAREAEERARAELRAAETHAQREIGSLIRLASDALHRGNSRKAARFRMGIEEAMQVAPAVPPHIARNLQQLDDRLNELKQWKDYAVAPKRIELIEEMEALVGSEEEPEALAEHIRALQQEWRTINKGIASDAPAETERFQKAFQAAFKPCQEFFAVQAAARRENLEARKQVLERLKAFEATQQGEQADFPLVAQVLREAPREWRSHSPVDRDASRPAEIEFQQSMDRLRAMLNGWYERNEAAKKSLIAQARHLSTVEDTTAAIDGVKRLNVLWKETGPVPREQSQALWDEFRSLCDAVFQRREQAYAQYSAGLEAAKAQAVALCEQVEQAAGDAAADRIPGHAKVVEWHAAFEALGELPRADARNLRDRFQRAVSRYEDGLTRQDSRDAEAAESNLFEAARLVRAYERAVMRGEQAAEREALKNAAESFMAGVRRWPKGGLQALKQALARADSASVADDAAREQALRMLCIRCEILTSTPTPTEDETLRRDYQMRLLMESMGQGKRADAQTWDAMLLEWIEIGAVAPETHEELQRRFMRCLAKKPAKNANESQFRNYKGDDRPARDPDDRNARRDGRGRPDNSGRGRSDSGGRR
jgi:hypothetical protein